MVLENAKQFLEQVLKDEPLRARVREKEPAEVVSIARELGFDVTAEELEEAVQAMRQASASKERMKELGPDELDDVAGGTCWVGEDAPDGHEMGCFIFYHQLAYSKENNVWCKEVYYCQGYAFKSESQLMGLEG